MTCKIAYNFLEVNNSLVCALVNYYCILYLHMKYHIIYLPGLGDDKPFQPVLFSWWPLLGVRAHFERIGWSDGTESFKAKLQRVLDRIDVLARPGCAVSLIGASAGASMAVHAYSVRQDSIRRVILICGKIQNIETVSEGYYHENPAFRGSLERLPVVLKDLSSRDKAKMLIVQPRFDNVVNRADMLIPGVEVLPIPTSGHAKSIAAAMTIYSRRLVRFIKSYDIDA